jgi:GTP cyclohydrolase I
MPAPFRKYDPAGSIASLDDADEPEQLPPGDARTERIAEIVRTLLSELELDLTDPNLTDTPRRVARMYQELFASTNIGLDFEWRTFPNTERYSQIVAVYDVPFYTMCAHHFLPFFGTAHVAYIPGDKIVGLSKLARLVDFYAHRPQIQERMTEQVLGSVRTRLEPQGAMVILQARHFCMEMRGVQKPGVFTTTSAIYGVFDEARVRQEFLALLPSRTVFQ